MAICLTEKQQRAYDLMIQGKNVLITGPSGVGKSLAIQLFREKNPQRKKIAITSTTGISALLIGGSTLHSYLGIGLGTDNIEQLSKKIGMNKTIAKRWKELDVLIIDEISMLSPELFDKLEAVARIVRRSPRMLTETEPEKPFGGIQLVLSGDFLQLPVVGSDNFCFEAKSWEKCVDEVIYMDEVMRQSDEVFQRVLQNIRYGKVTKNDKKILSERVNVNLTNDLGIKPTIIHTTNAEVDAINERELDKLATEDTEFFQYDIEVHFYEYLRNASHLADKHIKNCIAPASVQLCVGAQVMLLSNLDLENGLANGSRGVVTGFSNDMPIVKFLNGHETVIYHNSWEIEENHKKILKLTQIPLKLAYAITAHKSQGCTLDYAEVDLSNIFTWAMGYVALSRVKSLEGLSIKSIDFSGIKAHPKAVAFYKNLE